MKRRAPVRARRNSLDARPPEILHPTRSGAWPGVFTSGEEIIAESYAQNAAWNRDAVKSWPVVFALDTHGMKRYLDPSASQWAEGAAQQIDELRKALARGESVQEVADGDESYQEESMPSVAWELAHRENGEQSHISLAQAIVRLTDGAAGDRMAKRIASTGKIPVALANSAVNPYRYMESITEARVLSIRAVRPWWNPLLSGDGDEAEKAGEILEAAGYQAFSDTDYGIQTSRDWGGTVNAVTLFDSGRKGRRTEFHGTVADLAAKAFPFIAKWPSAPLFPVTPQSDVWERIADADLESAFQ